MFTNLEFLFPIQGPMAFYKGFIPNFGRLGSWNVIMFLTLEQVNGLMQLLLYHLNNGTSLFFLITVLNTLIQAKKYVRELDSSKKH